LRECRAAGLRTSQTSPASFPQYHPNYWHHPQRHHDNIEQTMEFGPLHTRASELGEMGAQTAERVRHRGPLQFFLSLARLSIRS